MRVPALAVLIAVAPFLAPVLAPGPAAADEVFRARLNDYLADHGGCPASRTLVERELVAFERGRAEGEPGSLALFGKLAADWTGADIADLLAVIRVCEALRGRSPAEDGERRLAERLEHLAQAMRRAIVLSAQPSEVQSGVQEASAHPVLRAGALSEAGAGGQDGVPRTGRRGYGPAFVPLDPSRAAQATAADEARRAAPGAAPPMPAEAAPPEPASPSQRRDASGAAFAPGAAGPGVGSAFRRAAVAAEAPAEPCAVTRERFARIRTGMTPVEVETVFGCRGRLDSAAAIDGIGTFEVYVWSPPSLAGSVTVTFQDRRLKAKVQRGLI